MSLTWCNIISFACLIALTILCVVVIIRIFATDRKSRVKYLRNFKKGKCAMVYFIAIPLYFIGYMYSGEKLLPSLFQGIARVINLVVLKYEYTGIKALLEVSLVFKIALHFCFVLVAFNAILLALSLFGQRVSYSLNRLSLALSKKDRLYILGNREENLDIYLSEKNRAKRLVAKFSDAQKTEFYKNKVAYLLRTSNQKFIKEIIKASSKRDVVVVVNEATDEENLTICEVFSQCISENVKETNCENQMERLHVYVFGNPEFQSIYSDFVKRCKGCMHYVNKYHQVAVDFVDNYPLTLFMNKNHIDFKSSLIKPNVNINVIFIGFGKTNREIFLTSVANNQFLTQNQESKELELKKVDYYIFDKEKSENNKNLNHNYYRFKNELKEIKQEDYLPFPSLPAEEHYKTLDVNCPDFYLNLKEIMRKNKNDVNVVIIAFGSDLVNIDMAKKLTEKKWEWGVKNCKIFVKSRKETFLRQELKEFGCEIICNEKEVVYNIEEITNGKLMSLAKLRNEIYDLEYAVKKEGAQLTVDFVNKSKESSKTKWFLSKTEHERKSSLYCCLSLRSKLNLLNLDICDKSDDSKKGISESEYLQNYAKNDSIEYASLPPIDGKKIVEYPSSFTTITKRSKLAVLEHYRWNSFMISQGFIPASKDKILNEVITKNGKTKHTNGKLYEIRRHGNITTFEGLKEYAHMLAERNGTSLKEEDVISYDFQILDDAFWLCEKAGWKIYERNKDHLQEEQK